MPGQSKQKPEPKPPKRVRQVAVVPVRFGGDRVELCLIRRKGSTKWAIPKGFIDWGDSSERAALTEAFEEAGVKGQLIGDAVGTYDYKKWSARLTVAVYVMEVLEEQEQWLEMRLRDRAWRPLEEAEALLSKHPVRIVWDRVKERLATR